MDTRANTSRSRWLQGAQAVVGLLGVMWVVQLINSVDSYQLDAYGIMPRDLEGLRGVVFSPFLHASFAHIIGNTVPFAALGLMIAFSGAGRVLAVTAIVALVAGLGTWATSAAGSDTVGASGVVFGYAGYLVARGFFNRRLVELALGAFVAILFGGALLASLVPHTGISWEDHAFGALGGVACARLFAGRGADGAPRSRSLVA